MGVLFFRKSRCLSSGAEKETREERLALDIFSVRNHTKTESRLRKPIRIGQKISICQPLYEV